MVILTQLPPEVILNILGYVDPDDLARVPKTCRFFYHFTKGNVSLHRTIYSRTLDTPPANNIDWEQELQDLVRLERICASTDKHNELPFVYNTVTRLLRNAATGATRTVRSVTYPPSRNVALLSAIFEQESNREAFLSRSFLFERARGITNRFENRPREEHQQSAKLHSLYGMPQLRRGSGRTRSSSMYPFACSKVYDLREYTEATRWGPFMNDGSDRVDWEKVEAILLVLRANIKGKGLDGFPIFANFWNIPFAGSWSGSYVPWPADREKDELEQRDPYDVSGTWMRVVCFLDYNDFFSYNFPLGDELPDNVPRQALDIGEAIRLILMKIHVTKIEYPSDGQGYPVVHFRGLSRSLDGSWDENANSDLRGTAQMTPEGEVRWTTYSIFNGQERWKSEGIQLGGVRSARGIVGNWFEKDYDPHGPCGPTAFWKVSDRDPQSDDAKVLINDFLPIVDGHLDEVGETNLRLFTGQFTISDHVTPFHFHFSEMDDAEDADQHTQLHGLANFLSNLLRQRLEDEDDDYSGSGSRSGSGSGSSSGSDDESQDGYLIAQYLTHHAQHDHGQEHGHAGIDDAGGGGHDLHVGGGGSHGQVPNHHGCSHPDHGTQDGAV